MTMQFSKKENTNKKKTNKQNKAKNITSNKIRFWKINKTFSNKPERKKNQPLLKELKITEEF